MINFEGNAQTIRIVTKLQLLNDQYGVNFTYGTLATLMKYPWSSTKMEKYKLKKFGYFNSESDILKRVQNHTGLEEGIRHPATFLLETADDIAYLCADLEDGVKKGIVPWKDEYEAMKKTMLNDESGNLYMEMFNELDKQNNANNDVGIPEHNIASIQNFKVRAQGLMFKEAVKCFRKNYKVIINGDFGHKGLLDSNRLVEVLKRLNRIYCYSNREVLTLELVGDRVINGLLDIFVNPLISCTEKPKAITKEGKLYELISDNFKYVCCFDYKEKRKINFNEISKYDKLLLITDFISGMTDSYAVNLYKELLGVKLP